MTKMIDADTILKRAEPLVHQHAQEIQPYGHLIKMPIALSEVTCKESVEHLRVLPVFGHGALDVSPRIGHLHITVDGAKWHFVDTSGETVILVGLEPGPHRVLFEVADPTHRVITTQAVAFTVPTPKTP